MAERNENKDMKTNGSWKLLMAVCAVAVCMMPAAVLAAEHPIPDGHKHVDVEIYQVPGEDGMDAQEDFPAKLDPRTEDWYKNNIKVRDQADSELCWAFSANTAAQTSYAKELYEKSGTAETVPLLSSVQLGYFFFNRVNDPLGRTEGDANVLSDTEKNWFDGGGFCAYTHQHLATWSGVSNESIAPFTTTTKGGVVVYDGPKTLDPSLAYQDELILENSEFYSSTNAEKLKSILQKYGAAVVSLRFGHSASSMKEKDIPLKDYLNDGKSFYNPDGNHKDNNHELAVIGWDDSYSRDNFSSSKHDDYGKVIKTDVKPEKDGAWIVMNSWGNEWGDEGYFYVSYESMDMLGDGILGMDMQPVDPTMHNYQYDGNAGPYFIITDPKERLANVFTADSQVMLKSVGITTYNDGETRYKIDIFTDLTNKNDPDSGIHAASQEVTTTTPGNKTMMLNTPVAIDQGESWAVVITTPQLTRFGIERSMKGGFTTFVAKTKKGQAFLGEAKTPAWNDMAKYSVPLCFRIKGFAQDLVCIHDHQPTGEVTEPTKSTVGYALSRCTKCGHAIRTDVKPMLDPVPNPVKLKSLTAKKEALTVKWSKSNEAIRGSHVTGYKIRYSLKSSMKSSKTVTVKGYSTTSKVIKGLKGGKKYYVQVSVYYKDSAGKTWTSKWSAKKSKKTKK